MMFSEIWWFQWQYLGSIYQALDWNQNPSGFGHHLAWRSNSLEAASHFHLGASVTSSWIQSAWVLPEAKPNSYALNVQEMLKIGKETLPCMSSCSFLHRVVVHVKAGWSNTTLTFSLSMFLHFVFSSGAFLGIWSEACSASNFPTLQSSTPLSRVQHHPSGYQFCQQQSRPKNIQTNLAAQKAAFNQCFAARQHAAFDRSIIEKWITMRANPIGACHCPVSGPRTSPYA